MNLAKNRRLLKLTAAIAPIAGALFGQELLALTMRGFALDALHRLETQLELDGCYRDIGGEA